MHVEVRKRTRRAIGRYRTLHAGSTSLPQAEVECGAEIRLRLDPNPAAMLLHDLPGGSQAHARAGIFIVLETLEQPEDAITVPGIDTDAVITDREYPHVVPRSCGDVNLGPALAAKLDRVFHQARKYVADLIWVAVYFRKGIMRHHCTVPLNLRLNRGLSAR